MRDAKTLCRRRHRGALVMSALPAAAQTGRIGGTVKDDNGQPIKGATVVAENPAVLPLVVHGHHRRPGPLLDHRPPVGHVEDHGLGARLCARAAATSPIRTIGAPMPPVDFMLTPGAAGPTGALAGVNTKELQAELPKAEDW